MTTPGAAVTAVWPLQVALAAALEGDAALQTALGGTPADPKVHSGQVPEGFDTLPYLVLGTSPEDPAGTFGATAQRLHAQDVTLHAFGRTKADALALYGHVVRVLDLVPLPVTGHQPVVGRVRLVLDVPEADGAAHHAVVRYTALSVAVPA